MKLGLKLKELVLRERFWWARVQYRVAVWLVGGLDGMLVSKAVYTQGVELMGGLAEYIEKSGCLRHKSHSYHILKQRVEQATASLVNAAKLGGGGLQLDEVRDRYMAQRMRMMSRRRRRELQYQQALDGLAKRKRDFAADLQAKARA